MMKLIITTKISVFWLLVALVQYTPRPDLRSTNDHTDDAEFQLASSSETNFLRFFYFLYFSNHDPFRNAAGGVDFSKFKELLSIDADIKAPSYP